MLPLSISYLIGDLGLTHLKTVKKYVLYVAFSRDFEKKGVYWNVNRALKDVYTWGKWPFWVGE